MTTWALLPGCGADSAVSSAKAADAGPEDVGTADVSSQSTVVAVSTGAETGPRVELEGTVEKDQSVTVRVLVRDFDNLYAIASHLTWDKDALRLLEHKGHTMMLGTGYLSRTLVKPAEKDTLLLGAARFRNSGSPWAKLDGAKVGTELWATLRFELLGEKAELRFSADHSLARMSTYKPVDAGWQTLAISRSAGGAQ